jgi:hypothetical protein
MKKFLTCSLILSSLLCANEFDDALKNGKFKGDFALHFERYYNKNAQDSSYSMYSVGLMYKSAKFYNFNLNLGFRANNKINELNDGDFDDTTTTILHTANLTYYGKDFKFLAGRNKETYQWIHGFQEELKLSGNIDNFKYTILHAFRHGRANNHEELKAFNSLNNGKGLNLLDIVYNKEFLNTNIYFYNARTLANWYGITLNANKDNYNAKLVFSKSNELTNKPNGSYFNIEGGVDFGISSLNIGYIKTDKKGGIGSMGIDRNVYNNMNPLEEGNHIFKKNAKTIYSNISIPINDKLSLSANLGHIDFQNKKAKEFDLYLDYDVSKKMNVEICFDKYDSDINDEDSKAIKAQFAYKF